MSNLTAITPGTGPTPRSVGLPVQDTRSGTVITAEIPAVTAGPAYGVLLPDGSVWYPGSRRRLPAPPLLRVVVWVLAFAVLFAAAGDVIIHYRPSWVAPLRHTVSTAGTVSPSGTTGTVKTTSHTSGTGSALRLVPMNPQPPQPLNGMPIIGYWVGDGAFTVTVTASYRVWVAAWPYADWQPNVSPTTAGMLQSDGDTLQIPGSGETLVQIGAGGTTISLTRGAHHRTVPTPPHCPCAIVFDPTH